MTAAHQTLVKICGVTRVADARLSEKLGACAIGLNFYEKSPRNVSPADAWKIHQSLEKLTTQTIGVFVNWKPELVILMAHSFELSSVQLHGDETPAEVAACADAVPVIKAFHTGRNFSFSLFRKFHRADAFLMDAAQKGQFGGTGKTFDWMLARKAAAKHRIILAGGLTPENVGEAILTVEPYAVDVASGVESSPGKKDAGKLREFFAEVSRANRALAQTRKLSS